MESRKIADEGKLVREKRDEDVRKIMEQLNSSEKIARWEYVLICILLAMGWVRA